jgi:hypothetical protein
MRCGKEASPVSSTFFSNLDFEPLFLPDIELHGVSEVRQAEIHTAEPLVPEPSALEVELAIEKLKSHKSKGIDQIP